MKSLKPLFVTVFLILFLGYVFVNVWFIQVGRQENNRLYQIEINRLAKEIEQQKVDYVNLDKYSYIKEITVLDFYIENQEPSNREIQKQFI